MKKGKVNDDGIHEASQENLPDTGAGQGAAGVSLHKDATEGPGSTSKAACESIKDSLKVWENYLKGMLAPVEATVTTSALPSMVSSAHYYTLRGASFYDELARPASPTIKPQPREQVVTGWRGYSLGRDGVLYGSFSAWHGARYSATCQSSMGYLSQDYIKSHLGASRRRCLAHLRDNRCSCGVWGVADPGRLIGNTPTVYANCQAWGIVMVDEDGNWRASDVDIASLFIVRSHFQVQLPWTKYMTVNYEAMADDLGARYRVPVRIVDDSMELGK